MIRLLAKSSVFVIAFGLAACGGSPPPETTEPAPPAPAPEPPPVAETPPAPPAEPPPPAEEPPPPRKAAKEFLMGTGWDFVLSYSDSDIKAKAQEDCEKKAKGDEAKTKTCLTQAEADAANDRIKFAPDDKGGMWFIYLGKVKGKEIIYNKIPIEVAKEETDKLTVTLKGKDKGKKPIKKLPTELVLEMPDEYGVILQHPDRGKLIFKVKVTTESGPKPIEEPKPEKKGSKGPTPTPAPAP